MPVQKRCYTKEAVEVYTRALAVVSCRETSWSKAYEAIVTHVANISRGGKPAGSNAYPRCSPAATYTSAEYLDRTRFPTLGASFPPDCPLPLPFSSVMQKRVRSVPWDALTDRMLAHARANLGSNHRLQKVIHKLQQGHGVRIAVLGGSVTAGYGCEGMNGEEMALKGRRQPWKCAWSSRLEEWLQLAYPSTPRDHIQVVNMARAATTTQWAATFLGAFAQHLGHSLSNFDLFIVDYLVNDQDVGGDAANQIQASTEELLVQLLSLPQAPAVVYFFTGTLAMNSLMEASGLKDAKYYIARSSIEDEQMRVLRYYDIPVLSWRDAFWPSAFSGGNQRHPLLDCHDAKHPTECLHYLWAAVASHLLLTEIGLYCADAGQRGDAAQLARSGLVPAGGGLHSPPYTLPLKRLSTGEFKKVEGNPFSPALTTLVVDNGQDGFAPSEMKPAGRWQFREDAEGKPGWIVEGPGGGEEISFDVLFSRRIVLGFMSSYENMGQVQVFVDKLQPAAGPTQPGSTQHNPMVARRAAAPAMVVDSLWQARSSQYSQKTILNSAAVKKPPIWLRVRIRRLEPKKGQAESRGLNKFKLLALLSY
eukprot:jgi/Mesvir1/24640/Mv21949-RA.1